MTLTEEPLAAPAAEQTAAPGVLASLRAWPLEAKLFAVGVLALYAPVFYEAAQVWLNNDAQAHGVFIVPLVLVLCYMMRSRLTGLPRRPTAWGLAPLLLGLALETGSYLLRIKFVPVLSLTLVLAGGILVLHGPALWRTLRFVVLFLAFAAPMPDMFTLPVSSRIQNQSTTGAVMVMQTLGYTLVQTGNQIDTPTISVEVAEVCSGFKKLTALVAFGFLFGFVSQAAPWKRSALVLAAYPVALATNVIRVCALIAIGSAGGLGALHRAHDWAEFGVLIVAFLLYVLLGKVLKCGGFQFDRLSR